MFRLSRHAGDSYITPVDPLTLAGNVLSLNLLDATSYTVSAGTVTSITNRISGVAITEETNPPAFAANALSGRPCMIPDGTNDRMIGDEAAVVAAGTGTNSPITLFVAVDPIQPPAVNAAFFGFGNSGVASNGTLWFGQTFNRARAEVVSNSGASVTRNSLFPLVGAPTVMVYVRDNTLDFRRRAGDDSKLNTFSTGAVTPDRFALFCRPDSAPDTFSRSRVGQFELFNRVLTNREIIGVCRHMLSAWGLA